jgi:hypothetical protein
MKYYLGWILMLILVISWVADHYWQSQVQESLLDLLIEYRAAENPPFVITTASYIDTTTFAYNTQSHLVIWCVEGKKVAVFGGQAAQLLDGKCSHYQEK